MIKEFVTSDEYPEVQGIQYTFGNALWESYPFTIDYNRTITNDFGDKEPELPCKHCHSQKIIVHTRHDKTTYNEWVYICPRVVVAMNEGECNSTGVCIDCLLEGLDEINNQPNKS